MALENPTPDGCDPGKPTVETGESRRSVDDGDAQSLVAAAIDWNANGKADELSPRRPRRSGPGRVGRPHRPKKIGRPVECTPQKAADVERELARGRSVITACALAGVSEDAHYDWLSREDEGEPFSGYAQRVRLGQARGRAKLEGVILEAAEGGDWRAAKTYLQHQYPKDWSPRTEITGAGGGALQVQIDVTAAIDAALASRSDAEIGLPDFLDSTPAIAERPDHSRLQISANPPAGEP